MTKSIGISASAAMSEKGSQTDSKDIAEIPLGVFRHALSTAIIKHVRPPTRRHLGKKLRKIKPLPTTAEIIAEQMATAKGLPAEDEASGILRLQPGGVVKPVKVTASGSTYKFKLQDPSHLKAFFRLQERAPSRGFGATKINLSAGKARRGLKARSASMASGPARLRGFVPKGKAATRRMASISLSLNVTHVDENGDVTFGVIEYPPWMKQRLRAEIYEAVIEMGQRHLPVDPAWYETIRARLNDPSLVGPRATLAPTMPPPPSPPPRSRPQKQKQPPPTPKTTRARKAAKRTEQAYDVERIVSESGPWGGHRRWFVVEWSHESYEPSWEQWRNAGGEPGTPVLTWMPLSEASRLTAFEEWEAAAAAEAQAEGTA